MNIPGAFSLDESPFDHPGRCRQCKDYVAAMAIVGGKLVESPHCANWYGTFPNGCDRFQREPGSDDDA